MRAVRDREVEGRPSLQRAAGSTLTRLAFRALAVPVRSPLAGGLTRAEVLREAAGVGWRRREEGGDVIALAADFLAVRAELRERLRRPARTRLVARSLLCDSRAEALLDDVLVALVRGYEGTLELGSSLASIGSNSSCASHRSDYVGRLRPDYPLQRRSTLKSR